MAAWLIAHPEQSRATWTRRSSSSSSSSRGASARTTTRRRRGARPRRHGVIGIWANIRFGEGPADYFWIGAVHRRGLDDRLRAQPPRRVRTRDGASERAGSSASRRMRRERAVADERQRIARELHDVIAHSVSVMTVQAGAVRRLLLPDAGEGARGARDGRGHRAGGAHRDAPARRSAPRAGRDARVLAAARARLRSTSLLDGVRAAGLPVELEVEGEPRELPPGVDLAAYRVVQEALTNALEVRRPGARLGRASTGATTSSSSRSRTTGRATATATAAGTGSPGCASASSLYGGEIESGPSEGRRLRRARAAAGDPAVSTCRPAS